MSGGVATGGMRRGPNGTCELDVGSVIAGRYELARFVGRGAMGVVFEAQHLTVGRRLAVKVLSHEWAHDPNMGVRFRAEARAASAAGHPNIVEVFDAGELEDGRPYLVMEYLEGRELLQVLREEGPFEVARACRVMRDVARGVHVAHEVGVVHRDLKAENVFIVPGTEGKHETVKVLDFGIATRADVASDRMTTPGVAVGTPEYMAPEQAFGARPQPAFDIYAIGVLLFELLTGAPPFVSSTPVQVLGMKAATPAPKVSEQRDDVPRVLVKLIAECLEIDPEERPRTAAEIAERLDAVLAEQVRPVPLIVTPPPRRVHPWAVAGATAVAIGAVLAMFVVGLSPEPTPMVATGGVLSDVGLSSLRVAAIEKPAFEPAPVVEEVPVEPEPVPVLVPDPPSSPKPKTAKRAPVAPAPAEQPPEPEPKPTVDPEPVTRADAPECQLDRRRAAEAREVHDWSGALRYTADKSCWTSSIERKRLRVQAYMELGRWQSCNEEAAGSDDAKIHRWTTICTKRLED